MPGSERTHYALGEAIISSRSQILVSYGPVISTLAARGGIVPNHSSSLNLYSILAATS